MVFTELLDKEEKYNSKCQLTHTSHRLLAHLQSNNLTTSLIQVFLVARPLHIQKEQNLLLLLTVANRLPESYDAYYPDLPESHSPSLSFVARSKEWHNPSFCFVELYHLLQIKTRFVPLLYFTSFPQISKADVGIAEHIFSTNFRLC